MKNEQSSKDRIQRASSSTSVVLESVDLTVRPTTSTELNLLSTSSGSKLEGAIIDRPANQNASTPQQLAAEVIEVIIEEAFEPPAASRQCITQPPSEQLNALTNRQASSQPNIGGHRNQVGMVAGGLINSSNAMHSESFVKESKVRIPPSYSTVLKLGPPATHFNSRTFPSIPFITRQPPPSYGEVHGWADEPSLISADSYSLGPNPLYVACPRCRTIVISDIHTERSHLSYVVSLVLCVFMCWPCCLLPFCLKSCRNTYHFCPSCHHYLGVYRPC